jgi:hypothetical protein
MADDLVERAARALYECEKYRATHADEVIKSALPHASGALLMDPWEECKDVFLSDARAAIAAMREPTEAMKAVTKGGLATMLWQEMIDAALKESDR